ncbi:Dehydrogenase/reductase SDR family member 7, partial [Armadillidium vulgare]
MNIAFNRRKMSQGLSSIFVPNSLNGLFHFLFLLLLYSYVTSYIYIQTFIFFVILLIFVRKCHWYGASTGSGKLGVGIVKRENKIDPFSENGREASVVKKRCIGNLKEHDILVVPFDMTDYSKHNWAFSTVLKHFGK